LLGEARNEYQVICRHGEHPDYICKQKISCALSYNYALDNPYYFDLVRCPYGDWKRHSDEDDEDYNERLGINPVKEDDHDRRFFGPRIDRSELGRHDAHKLYLLQRNGGPNGAYDSSRHGSLWSASDVSKWESELSSWERSHRTDSDDGSDRHHSHHHSKRNEHDSDDDDDDEGFERSPSDTDWLDGDDWDSSERSSEVHDAHFYNIQIPGGLRDESKLQKFGSNRHKDHFNRHGDHHGRKDTDHDSHWRKWSDEHSHDGSRGASHWEHGVEHDSHHGSDRSDRDSDRGSSN